MTPTPSAQSQGIVLMVLAVFMFTLMDVVAKAIGQRMDPVMAIWARYTVQMLIVLALAAPRLRQVARTRYPMLQFYRSVTLFAASTLMFIALARMGLADATAVVMTNPVLITLGAALFLGEHLGWRRLIGVGVSLAGAMLIIQPGTALFTTDSLLPLIAAVCLAVYSLLTRRIGRDEDAWTNLFYTALLGAVLSSMVVWAYWVPPDLTDVGLLLLVGVFGLCGQFFLIRALTRADAGIVAPFAYFGTIFAVLWGLLFFGEWPDLTTLAGALAITLAGLYVWHRETRAAPRPRRAI